MGKWGKYFIALAGYFVFGLFGAAGGFVIGLIIEKLGLKLQKPAIDNLSEEDLDRANSEFIKATFSIMGYMAEISSPAHADTSLIAKQVMDRIVVPENRRGILLGYFTHGQATDFAVHDTVSKFNRAHGHQHAIIEMFIELQLYALMCKGEITSHERNTLSSIAYQLDVSENELARLENVIMREFKSFKTNVNPKSPKNKKTKKRKFRQLGLKDAYAVLNTTPDSSDDEVKQAYRRLTSRNHPDKLIANNMPDHVMRLAEEKTREIRDAYERIRDVRDF